MELLVQRLFGSKEDTIGTLFIDCEPGSFTLEDEYRTHKVFSETRVPAGRYKVSLRAEGGTHERYKKKFPDFHRGMLCIHNAPDWKLVNAGMEFQYILIHIGNDDDDTAGCLLVGDSAFSNVPQGKGSIGQSTQAYERIYKKIAGHLVNGGDVWITYKDEGEI